MYIMYDEGFENFCQKRYQNYVLVCEMMGITEFGTYHEFKVSNIEMLEDLYNRSEERKLH